MTDAWALIDGLVGQRLRTITQGKVNVILRVEGNMAIVATDSSPSGSGVSIRSVQDALDTLDRDGEVRLDKKLVGHRSAFIGAVLSTLPDVEVQTWPRVIRRRG